MANDITYITIFFTCFLLLGFVVPFINAEFNQTVATTYTYDSDGVINEIITVSEEDSISGLKILTSMIKIFFFTFGDIPQFLDLLLFIPRAIFGVLVYRQIRSGGG